MRESLRIDSPFMGAGMPKAYSRDLRERVMQLARTGASRREAAERFEVSVASAVKVAAALVSAEERRPRSRAAGGFRRWKSSRSRGADASRPTAGPDNQW